MRRLAILSYHSSPLNQPGVGDSGGMDVYVREMASALARLGIRCDVFTRRTSHLEPDTVLVEPNLRVHHVAAGPVHDVPLAQLEYYLGAFTDKVLTAMTDQHGLPLCDADGGRFDAIHANYWLSAVAGHTLKHELDLPLLCTFHTLDRVKAETDPDLSPEAFMSRRAIAEANVIGCADAVLASCAVEAQQLRDLYNADPARISIIPLGIDHAFFAPGNREAARAAIGFSGNSSLCLFVGRIQPLKRADLAVRAVAELVARGEDVSLIIVGGPSGHQGDATAEQLVDLVRELQLEDRVSFVAPKPHHLLSSYYRAANVVLVPSRSESFGLVALEAASCGTPVVASNVGGLSTLVIDRLSGLLIDEADPSAYALAILTITETEETARRFSENAVAVASAYTWKKAASTFLERCEVLTRHSLVGC